MSFSVATIVVVYDYEIIIHENWTNILLFDSNYLKESVSIQEIPSEFGWV